MDTSRIHPAGAPRARRTAEEKRLALLEEQLRHELMDEEERCELRDRVGFAASSAPLDSGGPNTMPTNRAGVSFD